MRVWCGVGLDSAEALRGVGLDARRIDEGDNYTSNQNVQVGMHWGDEMHPLSDLLLALLHSGES